MDCPNCGEKPVDLISSLTFGGVGFKKALHGYFKCKHCDTLLKQSKVSESSILSKYKKPFWFLYTLLMIGYLGSIWFIYYLLEMNLSGQAFWAIIPVIIAVSVIVFMFLNWVKYKYWVIEVTTYEEDIPDANKMSTKGILIFCLYAVIAIAGFLFLDYAIDASSLSPLLYTSGAFIYMMLIIGGAVLLLNKFTGNQKAESTQ